MFCCFYENNVVRRNTEYDSNCNSSDVFFSCDGTKSFFFLKFQNIWSLEDISSSITLVLCMITYFSIILVKFKF